MKKRSTLDGKLKKYTAAAGTVLATAAIADAQVVYTNVDPDFDHNGGDITYGLDLDGDGTFDFVISSVDTLMQGVNQTNFTAVAPYGTGGNEIAGSAPSGYNYALALGDQTSVDANLTWQVDDNFMAFNVNNNNPYDEHWNGVTDMFLGLKFNITGNTHYGWARLDVDSAGDVWSLKDFAYEATPNTPIITSATVGVPTNGVSNHLTVFNSDRNLYVNINGELTNGSVAISNVAGQLVVNESIQSDRNTIALDQLTSGIYIVTCTFNEGVLSKRIFIK